MAIKLKVKTGDVVRVITGEDKGKEGKITRVFIDRNKAIVSGVNMVSKHVKPGAKNPQGGIVKTEAPIHVSNLMLVEDGKTVKVGYRIDENGKKIRFSKRTNKQI